jgi:uracil-DNA glycosylase
MNWENFIKTESKKEYFQAIHKFVVSDANNGKIFPKRKDLFNAFKFCPAENTKVLILGQDPYHGSNQAHGLSFSVPKGIAAPPSLKNIFKELKDDLNIDSPSHGCLESWAGQGVLLLNSVLTVREGLPGSHKNVGWETFTDEVIKQVNEFERPVVFMLWGAFAKSKRPLITNEHHLVLEAPHPSPFSANSGFFGCKHFSRANEFLKEHGLDPINWRIE